MWCSWARAWPIIGDVAPHRLFTAPSSEIDFSLVRSFLDLGVEEGFTIEYKSTCDAAVAGVAAMANTYGGVVLIGVRTDEPPHKDRPAEVVGVPPAEKERLVNKIATVLDPPWWCPEVIAVPTGGGDKVVLVVRIDADAAPRPVLHKGAVRVRMEGRNVIADRRMVRALFEEPGSAQQTFYGVPRRWPDEYEGVRNRVEPSPDLTVRAICSRHLRGGAGRPRLGGRVKETVGRSLSDSGGPDHGPQLANVDLLRLFESAVPPSGWDIDDQYLNSRFFRLVAGQHQGEPDRPYGRIECGVKIQGEGPAFVLETWLDSFYWCVPGEKLSPGAVLRAGSVLVRMLAEQVLPAATEALVGNVVLPVPAIEFHVASRLDPDTNNYLPMEDVVALDELGQRVGSKPVSRGGEMLRPDLVDAGRWDEAVFDAFKAMAMDWQILDPLILAT